MPIIEKADGTSHYKPSLKLRLASYAMVLSPILIFAAFILMQIQLTSLKMENENLQYQISVCKSENK